LRDALGVLAATSRKCESRWRRPNRGAHPPRKISRSFVIRAMARGCLSCFVVPGPNISFVAGFRDRVVTVGVGVGGRVRAGERGRRGLLRPRPWNQERGPRRLFGRNNAAPIRSHAVEDTPRRRLALDNAMGDYRWEWLISESAAALELAALVVDGVFYGRDVPRGDGKVVVVAPGLFGNDLYLRPLRGWLGRMGYRPLRSNLSFNAGCPQRLYEQVEAHIEREVQAARLTLIGHSRGGVLCRALAGRLGNRISHLITLGSPLAAIAETARGGWRRGPSQMGVAQTVADASFRARRLLDPECTFPGCGCPYPDSLAQALSDQTKVLCIYSRDDPIVSVAAARLEGPGVRNLEVGGTHAGLVCNREVYRAIATTLAQPG
jgi:triacylglycerol lipase